MNNTIHANGEPCRYATYLHSPGNYKRKVFLAMKLIVILLTAFCLQVSASSYSQGITIKEKNAPLEKVMERILEQSGYSFVFDLKYLKNAKPVNVNIQNKSLQESLGIIFESQPFEYQIKGKVIIMSPKKAINNLNSDLLIEITGKVVDNNNLSIPGVTVKVKDTDIIQMTGSDGIFNIVLLKSSATLQFSFVGYKTKEISINSSTKNLVVVLEQDIATLEELNVVSTGYQNLPKERATGSFVLIDNPLINRSVSTNILDRLANVTSGLIFNSNTAGSNRGQYDINIRGRSTIYTNDQPLIVLDNFPYEGDINTINPNDIENVTVLKDAAAASIWGARAGNGVIVITTRKGKKNNGLSVTLNSNLAIGDQPDMFYNPYFLNASDYIDVEKMLFQQGFYTSNENSRIKPVLSPVVELLIQQRDGKLSPVEAEEKIDALRNNDVRKDYENFVYRKSINQQYALNLNGGAEKATYAISAGFDKNIGNLNRNSYNRFTLNSYDTFTPIKNLELTAAINYTHSETALNNSGWGNNPKTSNIAVVGQKNIYPYAQLADQNGSPLAIYKTFRTPYLDTLGKGRLLDWTYRPLEEIDFSDNTTKLNDIRLNAGSRYSFTKTLNAEIKYQYQKSLSNGANLNDPRSYFVRNLINQYTLPGSPDYLRKIPLGGILDRTSNDINSYSFRGQVNYDELFNQKHLVTAMFGAEAREVRSVTNINRLYGYDAEHAIAGKVDYATNVNKVYPYTSNNQPIPNVDAVSDLLDRYESIYANASYVYDGRYMLSGSARKDASNLFGVNTNQRAVPLWSAGVAWNINSEMFYKVSWLPYLKLRATFGYNGNINKSVTAYTTAMYSRSFNTGLTTAYALSPANDDLRWERVKISNVGIDFALNKSVLSGSIEYYTKRGLDLFGDAILAPATGVSTFRTNLSGSKGKGIDILLNATHKIGAINWRSNFLYSYAKDEVVTIKGNFTSTSYVNFGDGLGQTITPRVGFPVYSIYSYQWAGLDATGDPQGYLNNVISKDYSGISNNTPVGDLVFNGSARPTSFGSFRNEFAYQSLSISFNISYKLGYYFRRGSISYSDLFTNWIGHKDFTNRWQQPGDELKTDIPALRYPDVNNRSFFYSFSSALVEKADHIRLQDITLNYDLWQSNIPKLPFKTIRLYAYANNIGILWRANKHRLDPDAATFPAPRTYAFGLKADF